MDYTGEGARKGLILEGRVRRRDTTWPVNRILPLGKRLLRISQDTSKPIINLPRSTVRTIEYADFRYDKYKMNGTG